MPMGIPAVVPRDEGEVGTESQVQCFNIDVEIGFWMSKVNKHKGAPLEGEEFLLTELIKFAYDSYIIHGGLGQENSWTLLMTRFEISKLSKMIRTSYAESLFKEIWSRVHGT